jgi:Asp-tRNA(Asn)/Glu-tRNA(Gln) amidotransferase A subunit family amidase
VIGPLARTVDDLELLYSAMAEAVYSRAGSSPREDLRGLRLAVYADDECSPVTSETIGAVQQASQALKHAGLEIVEELPPAISRGPDLWTALFARGGVNQLRALYAGHEDDAGSMVRAILKRSDGDTQTLDDYLEAWAERDRLRTQLLEYMESTPLLVAPVGAIPAFAHGARSVEVHGGSLTIFQAFSYCQTFNVYGLPVACVPAGRSPEGLPIGVQIIGRPFAEAEVLAAARVIEAANATTSTTDQRA